MKKLLLAGVALAALSAGAEAADLGAPRTPIAAAVMAPASTWTGFYAGLHLGYGWGTERFAAETIAENAVSSRLSGIVGGGQFGWNYQFQNNFVFGLEATLALAGIKGSHRETVNFGEGISTARFETTMTWLATMGPRLGYAIDRTLIYGKGGFAAAGFKNNYNFEGSSSGTHARGGWFLGAGVEHRFAPNWTVKLEYNYLDFSSGNWTVGEGSVPSKVTAHTVTLGVNYLFTMGPSAVSARY